MLVFADNNGEMWVLCWIVVHVGQHEQGMVINVTSCNSSSMIMWVNLVSSWRLLCIFLNKQEKGWSLREVITCHVESIDFLSQRTFTIWALSEVWENDGQTNQSESKQEWYMPVFAWMQLCILHCLWRVPCLLIGGIDSSVLCHCIRAE